MRTGAPLPFAAGGLSGDGRSHGPCTHWSRPWPPCHSRKSARSLVSKLILSVGFILLLTISTWSYFSIAYQKNNLQEEVVSQTERLSNTIKLGTHYAMMLNSRDDINQIINNIARLKEIQNIRIYNKEGAIKFSNQPGGGGADHQHQIRGLPHLPPLRAAAGGCRISPSGRAHFTAAGGQRAARHHQPRSTTSRAAPPAAAISTRRTRRSWAPWTWWCRWPRPTRKSVSWKRGSSGWRWPPSW
ncbi:MAG: hypothetical protein MZV70_20025 [Desulfobacterales bacterium]|nr:hypothetical protein [Desulfobacterales bacterium]